MIMGRGSKDGETQFWPRERSMPQPDQLSVNGLDPFVGACSIFLDPPRRVPLAPNRLAARGFLSTLARPSSSSE
jgi:hypothetical protein